MKYKETKYVDVKKYGYTRIEIEIRLDDECKNGHQDFAITGTNYDRNKWVSERCIHDEILEHFPEYKIFVDLHLCDYNGIPMHFKANTIYFAKEKNGKAILSDGFTVDEVKYLCNNVDLDDKYYFDAFVKDINYVQRRKDMASKAISILENLTKEAFKNTSIRSNYVPISDEDYEKYIELSKSGYYSIDSINQRRQEKLNAKINEKIEKEKRYYGKEIKYLETKMEIAIQILRMGFLNDNFILYSDNKLVFNWRDYGDFFSNEQVELIKKELNYDRLPKNIYIEFNNNEE